MSDKAPSPTTAFLSFEVAGALYALPLGTLREVIRMPPTVRAPQGPLSLEGLANLRGRVLPVVRASRLFRREDFARADSTRVLVLDRGGHVGLAVDRLGAILMVSAAQHEATDEAGLAFVISTSQGPVRVPDLDQLLRTDFRPRARSFRSASVRAEGLARQGNGTTDEVSLVGFRLAGHDFALRLGDVQEVLTLPDHIASGPRLESARLGVTTLRGQRVPVFCGRRLLGLPTGDDVEAAARMVVISAHGMSAGIAVDRTTSTFRVAVKEVRPLPAALARAGGTAPKGLSIARIEGDRLVSVLSAEWALDHEAVAPLTSSGQEQVLRQAPETTEPVAVFSLGDSKYGLPAAVIEEVARLPATLSPLPRSPHFVKGLINLRGRALPVIDMRLRLELPPAPLGGRERVLVLDIGGHRAGLLVDRVEEVTHLPTSAIEPAPEAAERRSSAVTRVANLAGNGRTIQLLDPERLLAPVEHRILARRGERPEQLVP